MKEYPKLLMADKNGKVYDVPCLEAAGMKGGEYFRMEARDLVKIHPDSELFLLPDRCPVGYDPEKKEFVELDQDPFSRKSDPCYAVAAFLAPGYTSTFSASYEEQKNAKLLPLFSYAAVAFYREEFHVAAIRVDTEKRQELAGMDMCLLRKNVRSFRKLFPNNRLVRHLEICALIYGCPAGKNFFLQRYEGPLPTSSICNASCIGCITSQPGKGCSVAQPRISFVPTAQEVAEIAIFHIREVASPVVSFGQGCEGEPLMKAKLLAESIKLIRKATSKGMINLNTNASKPDVVTRLFELGLDSIRVSTNSVRRKYYSDYYKPREYDFADVIRSIRNAKRSGGFVSINYLLMPGFSDTAGEVNALRRFLAKTNIDMIQWRNLNYDPLAYFRKLGIKRKREDMIGIDILIRSIKKEYPNIMHGYFNPSKARIRRARV